MTLAEKLDRLPPCICRLLAKRGGELMTDAELRRITGWTQTKLQRVAGSTSWSGLTVLETDAFLMACGLKWSTQRRERWLLQVAFMRGFDGIRRMRHLQKLTGRHAAAAAILLKRTEQLLRNQA